jgi:hypothetical protein
MTHARRHPIPAWWLRCICCLVIAIGSAVAATQEITGSPLDITIDDNQNATVLRSEIDVDATTPTFDKQYYSVYSPFLVMTPPGTVAPGVPVVWSGNDDIDTFAPVSNTISQDGSTIVTVSTVDNGNVTITQTVSYINGTQQYQHTWVVTNNGTTTYSNVALRYGGDTYFANSDEAVGYWDATLGFLYCTDPNVSGLMGMYGAPSTPATNYYEDGYSNVWSALENATSALPNTVNPLFIDNGMGLEWEEGTLVPNGSFTVTVIEEWTAAGAVQVLPPQAQSIYPGQQLSLPFTVQNLESVSDTFLITTATTGGVTGSTTNSVQIGANATATVSVSTVAGTPVGSTATVTVTATSQSTTSITNQGTVALTWAAATGAIQLTAPQGAQLYQAGTTLNVNFQLDNEESYPSADTFTFTATASGGFLVGPIAPVHLSGDAGTAVTVPVTVLASAGTSGFVQVTAVSVLNPAITSKATATMLEAPVAVTAQPVQHAGIGSTVAVPFTVLNNQGTAATFTFSVSLPVGMTAPTPASIIIPANSAVVVNVMVTINSVTAGALNAVTLTATAATTGQATTQLVLTSPVAIQTPPLSQGSQTVYSSICPSTPEGVQNLLTVMAPESSSTAQAYAWDASVQGYVLLPGQPAGGLQPSSGVFLATRHPLALDFDGTPTAAPFYQTLVPGWNFIGIPLLIDNTGALLTSHAYPSSFSLFDSTGGQIADAVTFANDLGTVGSGDASTANPYFYNGSSYVQVATLSVGSGYWIKNNTTATLTLSRNQTGITTVLSRHLPNAPSHDPGSAATRSSSSSGVLIDRGTPPPPPGGANSDSGSSHGCGLGTGSVALLGLSLSVLLARRFRRPDGGRTV